MPLTRPATVHPRACGERLSAAWMASTAVGSSPRLRGTGRRRPSSVASCAVHPRACGERGFMSSSCSGISGSSPRLRGTERGGQCQDDECRFIPAPAGNGRSAPRSESRFPVHPRACGERFRNFTERVCSIGSSPRLRGTAADVLLVRHFRRFIPAPAGNGCREFVRLYEEYGSSPRLRGTGRADQGLLPPERFIPAPAGNGSATASSAVGSAVHPRACGERPRRSARLGFSSGSSPRLRGTVHQPGGDGQQRRFIPAPAGNGILIL